MVAQTGQDTRLPCSEPATIGPQRLRIRTSEQAVVYAVELSGGNTRSKLAGKKPAESSVHPAAALAESKAGWQRVTRKPRARRAIRVVPEQR